MQWIELAKFPFYLYNILADSFNLLYINDKKENLYTYTQYKLHHIYMNFN